MSLLQLPLFNKVGVVVQFIPDGEDRGRGISEQEIFILLFLWLVSAMSAFSAQV